MNFDVKDNFVAGTATPSISSLSNQPQSQQDGQARINCEIRRGGFCNTHLSQSRKIVNKTKRWDRLKSGLYGHVYSSRISWHCAGDKMNPSQTSDYAKVMVQDGLKVGTLGTNSGGSRGLSGESLGTKRSREIRDEDSRMRDYGNPKT